MRHFGIGSITLRVAMIVLLAAGACLAQDSKDTPVQPAQTQQATALPREAAISVGRPTLFPVTAAEPRSAAATPAADTDRLGTATPKADLALGYLFTRLNPGDGFDGFNTHGGFASLAFNLNPRWGLVTEFTGSGYSRDTGMGDESGKTFSYLFGPRYSWRRWPRAVPFVQTLLGGFRASESGSSANAFAWTAGGGVDWIATPRFGIRLFQADYLLTNLPEVGGDRGVQHNFRLGTGILFRFGVPAPVLPPANRAPAVQCSASPSSVYVGDETAVAVRADASDADGDSLTYDWSASQGALEGTGPVARWNATGLPAGRYPVNVRVSDGKGGVANCETSVLVEPKPNRAPTLTCAADRTAVLPGERVRITGTAQDPDSDPLAFSWSPSAGQVLGTGSSVQLDTTGLRPARYIVTGRVEDGRGGAADCQVGIDVTEPPPVPQASKINECFFRPGSARVDNVCKRILDDVALRLNNEPSGRVVLVGFADPKEARPAKLGADRAAQAGKYLEEKGIAATRLENRTGTGQAGADKQNRRLDIIWLPAGATF